MEHELVNSWLSDHWYLWFIGAEIVLLVFEVIGVIRDFKKYKYNWHTEEQEENEE